MRYADRPSASVVERAGRTGLKAGWKETRDGVQRVEIPLVREFL